MCVLLLVVRQAPNMGRMFDLVAVAYGDVIDIYKLPVDGSDSAATVFRDVQLKIKEQSLVRGLRFLCSRV